ncbi:hypothetical protein B0H14DRAFT_2570905 [Mycena olivaceomarginata]|nr:hypothetical protein B0H14DRAFT_2570905 [Mycena olivaceomarginata]
MPIRNGGTNQRSDGNSGSSESSRGGQWWHGKLDSEPGRLKKAVESCKDTREIGSEWCGQHGEQQSKLQYKQSHHYWEHQWQTGAVILQNFELILKPTKIGKNCNSVKEQTKKGMGQLIFTSRPSPKK